MDGFKFEVKGVQAIDMEQYPNFEVNTIHKVFLGVLEPYL